MKLENLYLKKISVIEGKDDDEGTRTVTMMRYTTKGSITIPYIIPNEVWESKQKKLTLKRDNKMDKGNWTKKQTNKKEKGLNDQQHKE